MPTKKTTSVKKPAPYSLGKPTKDGYKILKGGKVTNMETVDKKHAKALIALKNKSKK